MSDFTSTVIVDLQLNQADARQKAVDLTNQIITLKDKQDLLRKSGGQLSTTYVQLSQSISQLQQQQKAYLTISQNEITSDNARAATLKLVTTQLKGMSDAEKNATTAGQALTTTAKNLKDQLNKSGESIGNFTGQVGNYTESINKSNAGQGKFTKGLTNVLSASGSGKANGLINLIQNTNSLGGAFEGASLGAVALGAGFAALAIGAVAVADHFMSLTPNANSLAQSMAGIRGYFRSFIDDIGTGQFDKLGDDMLKTAQEARGLEKAFQDLARTFDVLSVKNAQYDTQLTDLQLKLRRAAIDRNEPLAGQITNTIIAQSESRYNQNKDYLLKLFSASVGKATNTPRFNQDQIQSLLSVGASGVPDFRNIQTAANLDKTVGFVDKEDLQTLTDIANQIQANEKLREQTEEMAENRYERLKMAQERRDEARKNAMMQIEKDRIESAARVAESTMTIRQKEYEQIEADIKKRKLLYEKWGVDSTNLETERIARITSLDEKFRQEDLKEIIKNFADISSLRGKTLSWGDVIGDPNTAENLPIGVNATASNPFSINQPTGNGALRYSRQDAEMVSKLVGQIAELKKQAADIQDRISKGERDLPFQESDGTMSKEGTLTTLLHQTLDKIALTTSHGISQFNEQRVKETEDADAILDKARTDQIKADNEQLQYQEDIYRQRARLNEELAASYENLFGTISELAGKNSTVGKIAFAIEKSFAIAKIVINAEVQKSEIALAAAKQAAFYAGLGPFGTAAAAGILLAAGAEEAAITAREVESIATIAGETVATIAGHNRGGYISGAGNGTSDSIPARLSNGEFVMTAKATKMFAPWLSDMNVAGGGIPYANGGLAGSYVPTLTNQADSDNAITRSIMSGMGKMKPTVYVEDINRGQQKMAVTVEAANF